jgi:hypothetical protein
MPEPGPISSMRIRRSRKSRPFPNGLFVILALTGLAVLPAGCGGSSGDPAPASAPKGAAARPAAVTAGMTRAEVLAVWGRPDVKVREGGGERWSYWVRDRRRQLVGKAYVLFEGDRVAEVLTQSDREPSEPKREPRAAT